MGAERCVHTGTSDRAATLCDDLLIPAGIPELAKESTSREVKSGGENRSFSKAEDHGSLGIMDGAASTSFLLYHRSVYQVVCSHRLDVLTMLSCAPD